jgi:hypothetical protein
MTRALQRLTWVPRPSPREVAVASQVGLGVALILLGAGGRWLATSFGYATIFGGGIVLWLVAGWWARRTRSTAARVALILVDLWFVAYGFLLVSLPSIPMGYDDGTPIDPWLRQLVLVMGGPLDVVGVAWVAFGSVGAIAVWRSRA